MLLISCKYRIFSVSSILSIKYTIFFRANIAFLLAEGSDARVFIVHFYQFSSLFHLAKLNYRILVSGLELIIIF